MDVNAATPISVFDYEPLPDLIPDSDDENDGIGSEEYLDSDSDDDNNFIMGTAGTNIERNHVPPVEKVLEP